VRASVVLAAASLALAWPFPGAWAQASKSGTRLNAPAGDHVRYTILEGGIISDLPSEAIWRETRRGGKTLSAVLDVCHSVSPLSNRKERFVVTLRPEGDRLVGTGQSEPDRTPIAVSLVRKQNGATFALEGTIKRGSRIEEVAADELSDMSEIEFRDQQVREEEIVASPDDFSEVAPGSVGVRVSADGLAALVKTLRGLNVRVDYASLVATCADMRAGNQLVRVEAAPERAPALIAQLKTLPGVLAIGWTPGAYGIERAVRIGAGAWRERDALKADELAARISDAIATALGATAAPPQWDPATRELVLRFKRPDAAVRGLELTESIEFNVQISPDKPDGKNHFVIWIGDPRVETVDEGDGPRLTIAGGEHAADEDASAVDIEALLSALAKDLNGQRWTPEQAAWK
jgi:hypothetical protein